MRTLDLGTQHVGNHPYPVELPLDFVTESSAILAKKGSGKTNALIVLLEEVAAAGVPFVSVDPKGDHWGLKAGSERHPGAGLPVVVFGGLHHDVPLEPTGGALVADLIRDRGLSAVLDVSEFTIGERTRFLTAFADRLYRFDSHEPMLLGLEEAHEYIPQMVRGEEARMVGAFERLVKLGRSKGLGVVMVTQRSASLNKNVLTQVDNLFVMRTTSPQDRAAVTAWLDTNADRSVLDNLGGLQTGETVLVQPARGEPLRFQFRMRRTFDAGETPKVGEKRREPATIADVDLVAIAAAMADTIERSKAEDPKVLRTTIADLQRQLAARPVEEVVREVEKVVEVPLLSDDDRMVLAEIDGMLRGLAAVLPLHTGILEKIDATKPATAVRPPQPSAAPTPAPSRVASNTRQQDAGDAGVTLRAGARRMVEALGRMAPLRLTKAQWGTVAQMKMTSGTASTYLGDIRRLGFLDESPAGFTLTDAGFEYLGGRPAPMTAGELQDHYRRILRAGAVKMLDALMAAYPGELSREAIAHAAEMSPSSGTFSTYLGDLTRNGLADKNGAYLRATDVLMKGAAA
jgi:hypothetical protein